MRGQIRGSVRISAEGKGLYAFINELHRADVSCFEQYVSGGVFTAVVYRSDLRRVTMLAEDHGISLKYAENRSLSREFRRRVRVGLVFGAALVIAAAMYFSAVIVKIEVHGNDRVSREIIMAALDEIGIRRGTPFGQINYIWAENELRLMVDDIAWAGMHRTGHRLVVEVTEIREKPEMLRSRIPCNIVAARDGQIEYTTVLDGQLMRKVGDYVYAGDMLVCGVTGDDTGRITLHHAMGEITGVYSEEVQFTGVCTKERFTETGRCETRRTLRLLSLDFPLYFGECGYEYRDSEVRESPLVVLGKEFPVGLVTERSRELDRLEVTLTGDELRYELAEKIFLYEKNFLGGEEIIDRDIAESFDGEEMTLTVTYRLRGELGRQMEILIK